MIFIYKNLVYIENFKQWGQLYKEKLTLYRESSVFLPQKFLPLVVKCSRKCINSHRCLRQTRKVWTNFIFISLAWKITTLSKLPLTLHHAQKKNLPSFQSPVYLSRNTTDLRPLFVWMPTVLNRRFSLPPVCHVSIKFIRIRQIYTGVFAC